MTDLTPGRVRPTSVQWLARSLTVVLWATGSAYLVANALAAPRPSYIEIGITPILWAAVIVAPIMAHHAMRHRAGFAAVLLMLSGLVGSAWTLSSTIARQSEGADQRLEVTAAIERQRRDLTKNRDEAQEILGKYRKAQSAACSNGVSKRCTGLGFTVQTWSAAVDGYEAKLATLPAPRTPGAGPKRIAALLALLPGLKQPVPELEAAVELVTPVLMGVFIELAALAFGVFGFRAGREITALAGTGPSIVSDGVSAEANMMPTTPAAASSLMAEPETAASSATERNEIDETADTCAASGNRRKLSKVEAEARIVAIRRPVSQDTLAQRWGVTEAAISQWAGDWERRGLVTRTRRGGAKLMRPSGRRLRPVRAA